MDFSPEVSFFSLNFSCFGRYSGKKLVKMGSENGKMLENRKRKWIFNRKSANFSKFSRLHALCGKKLRNFATGNGNGVQKCLKTMFFEKKRALLGKKFEIYKTFSPPNRKLQAFYCVFAWQHFQISSEVSKNFFFRSKNPVNLRGFCPPNRK